MSLEPSTSNTSTAPRSSPCTCLRLRKISRQLTLLYDQQLAAYGLTVTQFSLLAHLQTLDRVGIGALAEIMVMDPTTLTRALRPLQRIGLVVVVPDDKDSRARRVNLTEKGRDTYEAARAGWRVAQRHVDDVLSAGDVPALNGLLDDLIERFKSTPTPHAQGAAQTFEKEQP
jgi:DNA-binding MarR family transcriptional regulator